MRVLMWKGKNYATLYDATDIEAAYMQFFRDSEEWQGPWEDYLDIEDRWYKRHTGILEDARSGSFRSARLFMEEVASPHEYMSFEILETVPAAQRYSPEL